MADHFYSIPAPSEATRRQRSDITVATSAQSSNPIEVRITDGTMTARQVYDYLEYLADLFARRDFQVVAPGTVG